MSLSAEASAEPFAVAGVLQFVGQLFGEPVVADAAVVAPEAQGHGAHGVFDGVEALHFWQRAIQKVGCIAQQFTAGCWPVVADIDDAG